MNEKVNDFRKTNLLLKTFTYLRAYSEKKVDHRQKLTEFTQKKNISLQLKCLAILIDSAHETKLKALKFVDLMKPVQHKQVAFALCQWIKHHQNQMRHEMAHSFFMQRTGLSVCRNALEALKLYREMRSEVKQSYLNAWRHYKTRQARIALQKIKVYAKTKRV